METNGKDEVGVDGSLEDIKGLLNVSNSGVALLSALGVASVGQSIWRYARKTRDERFLMKLVKHEATLERVDEIQEYCRKKEGLIDEGSRAALYQLASSLREGADERLRCDIGEINWLSSRKRDVAIGCCFLGLLFFVVACTVSFSPIGRTELGVRLVLAMFAISVVIATIMSICYPCMKDSYIRNEMNEMKDKENSKAGEGVIGVPFT